MLDDPKQSEEEKKLAPAPEVSLEHRHNYVGGAFAYKNSSQRGVMLDPENFQETVMMIGRGKARPVRIAVAPEDTRAGAYPQHNSPQEFREDLQIIESKSLDPYERMIDVPTLESMGYKHKIIPTTKDRLLKIHSQFAHLSKFAFNQMMGIANPDKRDFDVWYKHIEKANQLLVAYPYKKTGVTVFVQVISFAQNMQDILAIKHASFDEGKPVVVNETLVDQYNNIRQLAHLGVKGASTAYNSVERFDDGTVTWTVTFKNPDKSKTTGVAALKTDGEIVLLQKELNPALELAARNLGAEAVINDAWAGKFSPEACQVECHELQKAFKDKVRKQIGQIVDGANIPGLIPIFNPLLPTSRQ